MTGFPILAVSLVLNLMAFLFILSCILLILIILVQKGKGGGLSSAFGGGMASGILGSKTGDFLTWVTIVLVGVMLLLAVFLAMFYKPAPGTVPGSTGTPQTQSQPAAPTQETPPASAIPSQENNENNGLAIPSENPNTETPAAPAEGSVNTEGNESTNESSDTNQPGN